MDFSRVIDAQEEVFDYLNGYRSKPETDGYLWYDVTTILSVIVEPPSTRYYGKMNLSWVTPSLKKKAKEILPISNNISRKGKYPAVEIARKVERFFGEIANATNRP